MCTPNLLRRTAALLVIGAVALTGCDQDGDSASGKRRMETGVPVRIGLTEYTGDLPVFVALDRHLFEKHGIRPVTTRFGSSSEALNALIAGRLDVINPISFSALLAAEKESPGRLKLFLAGGENNAIVGSYLLVLKDSPIDSVADLKGKRIGTYTGATQIMYLRLFLQEVGLDPETDVTLVQVGNDLQVPALQARQFDALFTIEPTATIALSTGNVRVLVENPRVKYIVNPFISGAAAVSTDFATRNPDATRRILGATDEAVVFIRNNERESRFILSRYTPLDTALAKRAGLLVWYRSDEPLPASAIQRLADLLAEHKILDRRVEVAPLFVRAPQQQVRPKAVTQTPVPARR